MTLLVHETQGTLKGKIMSEGLKNIGHIRTLTDKQNEVLNKYKPKQFPFDRRKAVYFSFERDYIIFDKDNPEQMIAVDSTKLDSSKLFVFPNSVAEVILNHVELYGRGYKDLKTEAENYWYSCFAFQVYDENHAEIEKDYTDFFIKQGFGEFEYCPEVLYFGQVAPELLQEYSKLNRTVETY